MDDLDIDLSIPTPSYHQDEFIAENDEDELPREDDVSIRYTFVANFLILKFYFFKSYFNKPSEDVCYGFQTQSEKTETTDDPFIPFDSDLGSTSSHVTYGGQYGTNTNDSAHLSANYFQAMDPADGPLALAPLGDADLDLVLQEVKNHEENLDHVVDHPTEREKSDPNWHIFRVSKLLEHRENPNGQYDDYLDSLLKLNMAVQQRTKNLIKKMQSEKARIAERIMVIDARMKAESKHVRRYLKPIMLNHFRKGYFVTKEGWTTPLNVRLFFFVQKSRKLLVPFLGFGPRSGKI